MTTITPQLKTNELIDEITLLLSSGQNPDEFTLKRLKNEANKIIRVDDGNGHALLGMIAVLESDVDSCKKHYELAIHLNNDIIDYCNYASLLSDLGLPNEAYQNIKSILDTYPKNPDLLKTAMYVAFTCGYLNKSVSYYDDFIKLVPNENLRTLERKKHIDLFIKAEISEETTITLMTLANELIRKHKLRKIGYEMLVDNTEGSFDLCYWIKINTHSKKVVAMNIELYEAMAEIDDLVNQKIFSIAFKTGWHG